MVLVAEGPQGEEQVLVAAVAGHDLGRLQAEMRRRRAFETPMDKRRRKARSASKRNKVKWRFNNKSEEAAAETAEAAPVSAPEA